MRTLEQLLSDARNWCWMLLMGCLMGGCGPAPTSETAGDQPERAGTDFERLPAIVAGIGGGTSLYEGLPSAFWEPQLRETEATSKPTVELHGFRMYEDQPELSSADAERLRGLFADRQSYKAYDPGKNCTEFHADYCLEWLTAGGPTQAFVSLECGEVMLFGPKGDLHCDLTGEAGRRVREVLGGYRGNRPEAIP